jgi:hypothetical protein
LRVIEASHSRFRSRPSPFRNNIGIRQPRPSEHYIPHIAEQHAGRRQINIRIRACNCLARYCLARYRSNRSSREPHARTSQTSHAGPFTVRHRRDQRPLPRGGYR